MITMSLRSVTFAPDQWYHCFSRGVDKRTIFQVPADYERFLMLLYATNSTLPIHVSVVSAQNQGRALNAVLEQERDEQYVDICAYALMPNHYHLLLRERVENGIRSFMQKLGTGYTMFFNLKYERTGTLFSGRFKAHHVETDQYLGRLVNYIHANPAELFEPGWKTGQVRNENNLRKSLREYRYSSLSDFEGYDRPESAILNISPLLEVIENKPSFATLLEDARIYHAGLREIKARP